ncbi:MAG: AraC family transcriptional regulator [Pandoraea sp.]|nr:AraC family transcriptional regulator [Pandoraea sp.]MDR3399548.1 AraC family transcriptional regulator [Pandoraea sp.]
MSVNDENPAQASPGDHAGESPVQDTVLAQQTQGRGFTHDFAKLFNAQTSQMITTTSLKTQQMSATHMSASVQGLGMSTPMPVENGYVLALQLKHSGRAELWKQGRHVRTAPFAPGSMMFGHLSEEPTAYLPDPFECILFHFPRLAIDELSAESGKPAVGELREVDWAIDPVIFHLGQALLPALAQPRLAGVLFFDHLALAITSRLACAYGEAHLCEDTRGRVLSRREERIAKEMLVANLADEPNLADVARACDMSARQFVDAFRRTTGLPPHRWLRVHRVEMAKDLLQRSPLSLADIAFACGFSDQSHFTRTFAQATGLTPGTWRRVSKG